MQNMYLPPGIDVTDSLGGTDKHKLLGKIYAIYKTQ